METGNVHPFKRPQRRQNTELQGDTKVLYALHHNFISLRDPTQQILVRGMRERRVAKA